MMPLDHSPGSGDEASANRRIDLTSGGSITFEPQGFRIVWPRSRKRSAIHPYESMTHVHAADHALLIGTRSGVITIRNNRFQDPQAGPGSARRLLLERLAARPDGSHWLQEIDRVDRLGNRRTTSWVTWATVALCVLGTGLQLRDPMIQQVGEFVPGLFTRGEFWRAVTAHFLHGMPQLPIHLAVNVGGLVVLGHLVERPLGPWRTGGILGCGAIGTILGIQFVDQSIVIGASGLVAALAGALLALEFNFPESLPAYWRLPRRLFVAVLLLQFVVIDRMLSDYVAGGAHFGGFTAGFLAATLFGAPGVDRFDPTPRLRWVCYATLSILILGVFGATPLVRHDMDALERHALRLLNTPSAMNLYLHENAAAWSIATEGGASPIGLDYAVALADRAVTTTGRMHPGILDTLAEALFQRGDRLAALLAIEEAIRLMPSERYFIEQRKRFSGERDPDDRPPPPGSRPDRGPGLEDGSINPDAPQIMI